MPDTIIISMIARDSLLMRSVITIARRHQPNSMIVSMQNSVTSPTIPCIFASHAIGGRSRGPAARGEDAPVTPPTVNG